MKRILPAAALAVLMSTTTFAASDISALETYKMDQQGDIYASELIGMRVYATEQEFDQNTAVDEGTERDWDDIGEVNDVILGRDGSVKAVILGVGGFLGVGEKDVAVTMDDLKMVRENDGDDNADNDDFFLVINANEQTLNDAESYTRASEQESEGDAMQQQAEMSDEDKAEQQQQAEASDQNQADQQQAEVTEDSQEMQQTADDAARDRTRLVAPQIERDGYRVAEPAELTTDTLIGARVYGSEDEDVGEVDKLVLSESDGSIEKVVIDVGGFLGIGEHTIAVTMDEVQIMRTDAGDEWRVYIDATEDALESQPEYEGE